MRRFRLRQIKRNYRVNTKLKEYIMSLEKKMDTLPASDKEKFEEMKEALNIFTADDYLEDDASIFDIRKEFKNVQRDFRFV